MEITNFAPVIIPTLNRYEHFKRCLESLEGCTWSEQTDVYVGLDYPPSEKYVEGWGKINNYLQAKEKKNKFRNLYVRRRDHNCGIGKPGSNGKLLLDEVSIKSDTYIYTEDDNEFSPNFLDFINKGLEMYGDNENIYAVCGYNYPIDMSDYPQSYYFSHELAAWGYGGWFKKKNEVYNVIQSPNYIIDFYKRYPLKTYFKDNFKLMSLATRIGEGFLADVFLTSYLCSRNVFSVFPTISKVRNWGHDGSGVNCGVSNRPIEKLYSEQIIDTEPKADFSIEIPVQECVVVNKRIREFKKLPAKSLIKRMVLFFLIRIYSKIK